jgi:hypothetical protein
LTIFFCWMGPVWFYLIRNWTVFHSRLGGPQATNSQVYRTSV